MKDRALLHLLLAAGRSVGNQFAVSSPDRTAAIDQICETLVVERVGPRRYECRWDASGTEQRFALEADRFTLYARGDVAAIVERRGGRVDHRGDNWTAAHEVWAGLLRLDPQDLIASTRTFAPRSGSRATPRRAVDTGAFLTATSLLLLLSLMTSPPPLPAAILIGFVVVGLDLTSSTWARMAAAAGGAAFTAVVLVGLDIAVPSAATLAGLATLAGTTQLLPSRATSRLTTPSSWWAAAVVGVGAATSPTSWVVAAGVCACADVAACCLRAEPERLRRLGIACRTATIVGLASSLWFPRTPVGAGPALTSGILPAAWLLATIPLATWILTAPNGSRDRLSGWMALVALAGIASFENLGGHIDLFAFGSAGVAIVGAALTRRLSTLRRTNGTARPPTPTSGTAVTIGLPSRRDRPESEVTATC